MPSAWRGSTAGVAGSSCRLLEKVRPGVKVARYLQIESRIRAVAKYELAAQIPLVQ